MNGINHHLRCDGLFFRRYSSNFTERFARFKTTVKYGWKNWDTEATTRYVNVRGGEKGREAI